MNIFDKQLVPTSSNALFNLFINQLDGPQIQPKRKGQEHCEIFQELAKFSLNHQTESSLSNSVTMNH